MKFFEWMLSILDKSRFAFITTIAIAMVVFILINFSPNVIILKGKAFGGCAWVFFWAFALDASMPVLVKSIIAGREVRKILRESAHRSRWI